jgi:surface polysaccharide O-acyltransferase-like enzyme
MSELRKAYPTVDYLKFFCAILIIGIHTQPFVFNYWLDKGFGIITRLAVPYFFVASSYFLFNKMDFDNPRNFNIKPFLKRILLIYGVWSLVYLPFRIHSWLSADTGLNEIIVQYIKEVLIYGTYTQLWFLPALFTGVAIVIILLRFMKIKSVIALSVVVLCIVTLFSTYLPLVVKMFNLGQSSLIYYFPSGKELLNGFFYGFPYISFGAFLAFQNKKIFEKDDLKKWILWFAISMIGLCVESLVAINILGTQRTLLWFSQVPATLSLFIISLKSKMFNESPSFTLIRNMSILIYTSHMLFVRLFEVIFMQISNASIYHPVLFVSTSIATIIFTAVLIKLTIRWKWVKLLY